MQSSVMSVFRLPLNLLVVLGTKLTDQANEPAALQKVFLVLVGMHLVATTLQGFLSVISASRNKAKKDQ